MEFSQLPNMRQKDPRSTENWGRHNSCMCCCYQSVTINCTSFLLLFCRSIWSKESESVAEGRHSEREREKIRLIKNTNAHNKSYIVECLVIPFLFYFLLYALHFSLTHSLDFFLPSIHKNMSRRNFLLYYFFIASLLCVLLKAAFA